MREAIHGTIPSYPISNSTIPSMVHTIKHLLDIIIIICNQLCIIGVMELYETMV